MHQRTRRSPARFLAPLALIIFVIAFMAIVSGSGGNGGSSSSGGAASQTATSSTSTAKKKAAKAKARAKTTAKKATGGSRFYTIQAGDTLGAIAAKSGIPLSKIQELNPNVDPHAMTTGQKIRLR